MEEGFGEQSASHGGGRAGGVGKGGKSGRGGQTMTGGVKGNGKLGPPANKPWVEKWRIDLKIAGVSHLSSSRFRLSDLADSVCCLYSANSSV